MDDLNTPLAAPPAKRHWPIPQVTLPQALGRGCLGHVLAVFAGLVAGGRRSAWRRAGRHGGVAARRRGKDHPSEQLRKATQPGPTAMRLTVTNFHHDGSAQDGPVQLASKPAADLPTARSLPSSTAPAASGRRSSFPVTPAAKNSACRPAQRSTATARRNAARQHSKGRRQRLRARSRPIGGRCRPPGEGCSARASPS